MLRARFIAKLVWLNARSALTLGRAHADARLLSKLYARRKCGHGGETVRVGVCVCVCVDGNKIVVICGASGDDATACVVLCLVVFALD